MPRSVDHQWPCITTTHRSPSADHSPAPAPPASRGLLCTALAPHPASMSEMCCLERAAGCGRSRSRAAPIRSPWAAGCSRVSTFAPPQPAPNPVSTLCCIACTPPQACTPPPTDHRDLPYAPQGAAGLPGRRTDRPSALVAYVQLGVSATGPRGDHGGVPPPAARRRRARPGRLPIAPPCCLLTRRHPSSALQLRCLLSDRRRLLCGPGR